MDMTAEYTKNRRSEGIVKFSIFVCVTHHPLYSLLSMCVLFCVHKTLSTTSYFCNIFILSCSFLFAILEEFREEFSLFPITTYKIFHLFSFTNFVEIRFIATSNLLEEMMSERCVYDVTMASTIHLLIKILSCVIYFLKPSSHLFEGSPHEFLREYRS
jgi:hypothetical protein